MWLYRRTSPVRGVCETLIGERTLLASASDDGTLRLWDPATGQHKRTLRGHGGLATGVCTALMSGRTLVASASEDRTVRLWDPETGEPILTVPLPYPALSISSEGAILAVGITTGLTDIELLQSAFER